MFDAPIHIYRYKKSKPADMQIVGVAPLNMRDEVGLAVAERNKEAEEANTGFNYTYSIEDTCTVFMPGYPVKIA